MVDLRRWPHADAILDEALDRPAAERAAYIRAAAEGDDALVAALELVLAEADGADDFLSPGGALTGPLADDWADSDRLTATPSLEPGTRFGVYEIAERIGTGGMGEVYRAHDLRLRRDVALKVLPRRATADARARERLAREARLLASLNHPRIAAIYDLAEQDGVLALVLELVEGSTLAERLARGPLRIEDAIDAAAQIAEALDAAHARGIVHSDLKPANIKITDRGQIKVLDFGIARALDEDAVEPAQGVLGDGPLHRARAHPRPPGAITASTSGRSGASSTRCSPACAPSAADRHRKSWTASSSASPSSRGCRSGRRRRSSDCSSAPSGRIPLAGSGSSATRSSSSTTRATSSRDGATRRRFPHGKAALANRHGGRAHRGHRGWRRRGVAGDARDTAAAGAPRPAGFR